MTDVLAVFDGDATTRRYLLSHIERTIGWRKPMALTLLYRRAFILDLADGWVL